MFYRFDSDHRWASMTKIFAIMVLAFALTTGIAAVTVKAHIDQAVADCSTGSC